MAKHHKKIYFKRDRLDRLLSYTEREKIVSASEAIGLMIDEKTIPNEKQHKEATA